MPRPRPGRTELQPCGVAALSDGRTVVACRGGGVLLFDAGGSLVRSLAENGSGDGDTGEVDEPTAVAVEEGGNERSSMALVLDREGERVQAFTLEGTCLGAFHDLDLDARSTGSGGLRASSARG
jgi:hypothetical protein